MLITATCSGGYAGVERRYRLDTGSAADGAAVETLLAASDFFQAADGGAPGPVGADLQRWSITVDDGTRRHTVSFADDGAAGAQRWRPLLTRLRAAGAVP